MAPLCDLGWGSDGGKPMNNERTIAINNYIVTTMFGFWRRRKDRAAERLRSKGFSRERRGEERRHSIILWVNSALPPCNVSHL